MPIYSYHCSSCKKKHEVIQKMTDGIPDMCVHCGAKNTLSKVISRISKRRAESPLGTPVEDDMNPELRKPLSPPRPETMLKDKEGNLVRDKDGHYIEKDPEVDEQDYLDYVDSKDT